MPIETCLKQGCEDAQIYGSCMCDYHTRIGANPLGPDEEWFCDCGAWIGPANEDHLCADDWIQYSDD